MLKSVFLLIVMTILFSCETKTTSSPGSSDCDELKARREIEQVIRQAKDCNQRKDIECFINSFDSTFVLESNELADTNRVILKDTIKKDVLRDWSIIAKMYEVEQWIDSFHLVSPDTAIVYTDQFYHRSFTKPRNLPGEDDVVSTQKHRETWIRRKDGWKQSRVKELGGAIYVNGMPYNPQ